MVVVKRIIPYDVLRWMCVIYVLNELDDSLNYSDQIYLLKDVRNTP